MEIALIAVVVLLVVVILALVLFRLRSPQLDTARLDERLDSLNRQLGEVTSEASTHRDTIAAVNQALGGLTETSKHILEVGQDMRKLQEVFAAPTLRGGVGETMLEDLLRQTLPNGSYDTQHTFRNGNRVDAVIQLADGVVPVDAKFPLESFRRIMEAADAERRSHMTRFRRDVRGHVDAIADKYICPGETLDFALMYIPAENVYYEIVLKEELEQDILNYAWNRRVIPTSPNSLYAYLQVIALGLKSLQIEANAQQVLESLKILEGDFNKFARDYDTIGKHLRNARSKYDDGLLKLDSIQRGLPGQLTTGPSPEALETSENTDSEAHEPEE